MTCSPDPIRLGETATCTITPQNSTGATIYSLASDFSSISATPSHSNAVIGSVTPTFNDSLSFEYTAGSTAGETGEVSINNTYGTDTVFVSGKC